VSHTPRIARATLAALLLSACGEQEDATTTSLRAVTIAEQPPYAREIGSRPLRLSFEFDRAPACEPGFSFGVLIDADRDLGTGLEDAALAGIGADAQIVVSCADEQLRSSLGEVTIEGATVHIDTTVGELPSVDFRFIGFALDGERLQRIPAEPDSAAWAIIERRTP
jgi:hypothetical protein